VERVTGARPEADPAELRLSAPVADRVGALAGTLRALDDVHVTVADIALRRPTLDEVFLRLTDRSGTDSDRAGTDDAGTDSIRSGSGSVRPATTGKEAVR
ncbi:daunorubicin/doxorubicin resistance ABC transporter ATP-binding protein DrrA, partial [Actinomadura logoneensis]